MKLWFFRTPGDDDRHYLSHRKPPKNQIVRQSKRYSTVPGFYYMGAGQKLRGLPKLDPGECIPVKLVAEGKGGERA